MKLVETPADLARAAAELAGEGPLYLDTEFDSGRGESLLCLLQLSDGEHVFLFDALRLASLEALRPILGHPEREWVVHAGAQDVALVSERLALSAPPKLFDTQVAWALTSPEHSVSLAYLRFVLLGVRSGKSHQADDWRRRPLPEAQLAYAADDIADLPALRRALSARLSERGREHLVHAASLEQLRPLEQAPEPLALASFRNAWQLDAHGQAALLWLLDWYNGLAPSERANAPEAKALLAIASRLPKTGEELVRIKGVPRRFAARDADRLARELTRAAARADTGALVPIDPPPYATFDEIRLDGALALARAELSAELGLAPELAFPGRVQKKLRAHLLSGGEPAAAASVFEGWRAELLADAWRRFVAARPDHFLFARRT